MQFVITFNDRFLCLFSVPYGSHPVSDLFHFLLFDWWRSSGFYRVYQLLSQPFIIAVHKTVNVISSTGINLYVVTIIAVFKENMEADLKMVCVHCAKSLILSFSHSLDVSNFPCDIRWC